MAVMAQEQTWYIKLAFRTKNKYNDLQERQRVTNHLPKVQDRIIPYREHEGWTPQ